MSTINVQINYRNKEFDGRDMTIEELVEFITDNPPDEIELIYGLEEG